VSLKNPNFREIDHETGFEVSAEFRRFDQRDEAFCRSDWDPEIRSAKSEAFYLGHDMPQARARNVDGFGQRDYALRNAAWHVTNVLRDLKRESEDRKEGFLAEFTTHAEGGLEPFPFESPEQATAELKRVAGFVGADLVGVCAYDERWVYRTRYSERTQQAEPMDLPDDLPWVIVIGEAMDRDLMWTVPSALSGAATGMGYTQDAVVLLTLTQYLRNLGYRAYATMNDSALAVPLAAQAGLGEVGRHSLLITPEFGPRLRLGKIFTDLPLVPDRPQHFGVREFCEICHKCSTNCPVKAISSGEPQPEPHSRSNLTGVRKWTTIAEKCFGFWAAQNSDCSICIRVCPYNRDFTKPLARWWRWLAGTRWRRLALWIDDKLQHGLRRKASWWWSQV
jgi:hypothetical protein